MLDRPGDGAVPDVLPADVGQHLSPQDGPDRRPTFGEKKLTIQALNEITEQIQRYLLVQVFTSLLVGLATWLCFLWIGVQHAAVWGLAAGVLNLVPYIGSIVFTGASAAVGLMQFGNLESAVLIAGISLVLHTVSGYVFTPWLTSRTSRMNAVTVFVGVLAWGWLWGIRGLFLGVPILMVVKAVCDRIDDLKPFGELLSSDFSAFHQRDRTLHHELPEEHHEIHLKRTDCSLAIAASLAIISAVTQAQPRNTDTRAAAVAQVPRSRESTSASGPWQRARVHPQGDAAPKGQRADHWRNRRAPDGRSAARSIRGTYTVRSRDQITAGSWSRRGSNKTATW